MGILSAADYHVILMGYKENPEQWAHKEQANTKEAELFLESEGYKITYQMFLDHIASCKSMLYLLKQ